MIPILFCSWDLSEHEKWMPDHHLIGMDYMWDAIFKMATTEISGITFSPITQNSKIDRDNILVSKPMIFMWNPMRSSWVMLGPYIKSRGSRCKLEMSANAHLITVET